MLKAVAMLAPSSRCSTLQVLANQHKDCYMPSPADHLLSGAKMPRPAELCALSATIFSPSCHVANLGASCSSSFGRRIGGSPAPGTLRVRRATVRPRAAAPPSTMHDAAALASSLSETHEIGQHFAHATSRLAATEEDFMDSISRWIWHKIQPPGRGHPDFDWLAWLPDPIHDALHECEATAVLVVREILLLGLAFLVFRNADRFCRQLNWVWGTFIRKDMEVTEEEYRESGFQALVAPIQFFTVVLSVTRHLREGLPRIRIAVDPRLISSVRSVALVMAATWFLLGWKDRFIQAWRRTASKGDKPRLVLADRLASLALLALGSFTAAEVFGIPLRAVSAFGGITGIAIGLASKEVVTNFFGGAVLWLTRPFMPGDAIKADKFAGVVQDIGYFQTRLLGFDKSHITVPNQMFTNLVITNMSRATHRNLEVSVELRQEDILRVGPITQRISAMVAEHPAVDEAAQRPTCFLKALKDSSVTLTITAAARTGANFNQAQQEIMVAAATIVVEEGAALGTTSPFPPAAIQLQQQDPGNGGAGVAANPVSAST